MESFQNLAQVVEHCGGNFGDHPSLIKYVLQKKNIAIPDTTQSKAALEECREAYLVITFLCGLNCDKYQDLLDDLSNSYLAGRDKYPQTVVDAYNLVTNWKGKKSSQGTRLNDGINFNTVGDEKIDGEINLNRGILR